jgi:hypothetical protein
MSKKIIFTDEQIAKVQELAKKYMPTDLKYMPTDLIADYFGIKSSVFDKIKKRQPEVLIAYNRGRENALNSVKLVLLSYLQQKKNTADKLKAIKIYKKYFENNDA